VVAVSLVPGLAKAGLRLTSKSDLKFKSGLHIQVSQNLIFGNAEFFFQNGPKVLLH
jgi:hypothetical protein